MKMVLDEYELERLKDRYVVASNRTMAATQRLDDLLLDLDELKEHDRRVPRMKDMVWQALNILEKIDGMLSEEIYEYYSMKDEEEEEEEE